MRETIEGLPPLRPGKVWAIQLYPGGRSRFQQVNPEWISSKENAIDWIAGGTSVYVLPEDADVVMKGIRLWT